MSCSQKDEVYAAQEVLPRGCEFRSAEEAATFIEELRDLYPRWEEDFSSVLYVDTYEIGGNRSLGRAETEGGTIGFGPGMVCQRVALHELAHVLADSRYGSGGHGPWFARTYLELVYTSMGTDAYVALREAFEAHGVDCETDDAGGNHVRL